MPTFQKASQSVVSLANEVLCQFATHKPLLDCRVNVDIVMAYGDRDEKTNELTSFAITKNGVRAIGLTRKMSLKDRVMGRGDAEVMLDADWWVETNEEQHRALLDHELHHIQVKLKGLTNVPDTDDIGRPKLLMRPHDIDVGWFALIAARHGANSIERLQAKQIFDIHGQAFWPDLVAK